MIPIVKEPKELYQEFRCYEKCIFCNKPSDTWCEKKNKCVCKDCAKIKNENDITT